MSLVVYVDVDDTLVRSFGSKRIPMTPVIEHVKALHVQGATLYCWSTVGADYAEQSAIELGIQDCFVAFLPKPQILIDDQAPADWRRTIHVLPGSASQRSVAQYLSLFP